MNRKLLVNDLLSWSDLNETENQRIITLIESQFKSYADVKRKKTLPKKIRLENKKNNQLNKIETIGSTLKNHLRFGINSITKELEKDPNNLLFVLVCKSCKPILTRHIQVMCAKSSIPAGCVKDLSDKLSKFFNLKTVSALAVTKRILNKSDETSDLLTQSKEIIKDLALKIVPILPVVKDPFSAKASNSIITTEIKIDMDQEIITAPIQMIEAPSEEEMEHFGSDFISFKASDTKQIGFESNKFILFNDDYSDHEPNDQEEDNSIFENFNNIRKRKLTTIVQKCNDETKFNQFSIRYRPTNIERDKLKRSKHKKDQLMNDMQTNRFKNTKSSAFITKKKTN